MPFSVYCLMTSLLLSSAAVSQTTPRWEVVEKAFGRAGTLNGGVYKVSFPRSDLVIRVGRTRVEPAAALGSWMAFRQDVSAAVVNGDLVLLSSEVDATLRALQSEGFEITAIHNHLAGERPQVMYVHFFARGDQEALAHALKRVLAGTATPIKPAVAAKPNITFDQKAIEAALDQSGHVNGSVLAFSFPRPHPIAMHQVMLPPGMGMATVMNFQASPQGVAATGDFVVREHEVNRVISELLEGGASVTAVHNHLLDDEPRMVFIHFWAEGEASKVAKTLRQTLDASR